MQKKYSEGVCVCVWGGGGGWGVNVTDSTLEKEFRISARPYKILYMFYYVPYFCGVCILQRITLSLVCRFISSL